MGYRSSPSSQRVVGYLRRSTDKQEQSLADQRTAIERYASEHELCIARFYTDDAVSGTTSKRLAFQEMMADAIRRPRPFSFVLVYDVKRFGRLDNDEAGYFRHILRMHGIDVLYVSENFSGGGIDDLLRPVKQWQAREESRDLSKVTIRGLLSKVAGGCWLGGTPPYGYDLCYRNDKPPHGRFLFVLRFLTDGTKVMLDERGGVMRVLARDERPVHSKRDYTSLVPSDPERVRTIERIFRMSVEDNLGCRTIASVLAGEGIPSPRGPGYASRFRGTWTGNAIYSILLNPIYVGDLVWNRRTEASFHRISGGRAVERRDRVGPKLLDNPESDWVRIENTHPAIVSRQTFERAREARKTRPKTYRRRGDRVSGGLTGPRSKFLLSGLVECSRCGARYEGHAIRFKNGVVRLFYICGGFIRRGSDVCQQRRVECHLLERAIVDGVMGDATDAERRSLHGTDQKARILAIRRLVDLVIYDSDANRARVCIRDDRPGARAFRVAVPSADPASKPGTRA